jgi:hypothetical protein
MCRKSVLLFTGCLLFAIPTSQSLLAQWTRLTDDVYSPAFGEDRFIEVCLPPQYDSLRVEPYAVFVGLHSKIPNKVCEDDDGYTPQGFEPPIFVTLSGTVASSATAATSWNSLGFPWANSELLGPYEDYVFDIIAHVDSTYNTYGTREKRAVRGSSITGSGGARMGLKYHDSFAALMADNGYADLGFIYDANTTGPPYGGTFINGVLSEHSGPPYTFRPTGALSPFAFRLASALSPNMNNPPYYADFFLDAAGAVDSTVKAKWLSGHGTRYARDLPAEADVKIWIDYRPGDDVAADVATKAFADSLDLYGIAYDYMIHDCGHGGPCHDAIALRDARARFIADALGLAVVNEANERDTRTATFELHPNYPNPFSEKTDLQYRLDRPAPITLTVANVLGQRVEVLYAGTQMTGLHTATWRPASKVSAGIYFVTLQTSRGTTSRSLMLSR